MNKLLDNIVIKYPEFEKIAETKLSDSIMDWNDEIMENFFQQVDYLPKDVGVDISISNVDENNGYGKGSIIVTYGNKKINYPIIINKYKLSPFDVFIHYVDGKAEYYNSTANNINKILSSTKMGTIENMYQNTISQDVKSPGSIAPKQSTNINEEANEAIQNYTGILHKMSHDNHWTNSADKEDLIKFAEELKRNPGIEIAFQDNTGDLSKKIVELKDGKEKDIPNDHKQGILDVKDAIKCKQAVVAIDSEFFDTSSLIPVKPPTVCELRTYNYPSMEDFMESGEDAYSRFEATKVGNTISGVVLDLKNPEDFIKSYTPLKHKSAERDQIFISADGKSYSVYYDYTRKGFGFYGSKIFQTDKMLEKVMEMIKEKTSDENTSFSKYNRNSNADKLLAPSKTYDYDVDNSRNNNRSAQVFGKTSREYNPGIICIYGADDAYEAILFKGKFKKAIANDAKCFISNDYAILPAKVAYPQIVNKINTNSVYKMITGNSNYVLLIPENSIFINSDYMDNISIDSFMKPDIPIQKQFEKANIEKVSMVLGDKGYKINGKAVGPLYKIAGINPETQFNTSTANTILNILGLNKQASEKAMKTILNRASLNKTASVDIYNINSNYIKPNAFEKIEKQAKIKGLMKKIASDIKVNLIKEASMLDDPESVDVILSLNFINEKNLIEYVDNIVNMKKILSKLASLLIATRMGLKPIEETAIVNSIEGLQKVVDGLESIKIAIGK